MDNRQKTWLWISAAALFIVGILLVWNDSGAGWFLIILGMTYLGASTQAGQTWATNNPDFARWGLIGVTLLLIILGILVGAILLSR